MPPSPSRVTSSLAENAIRISETEVMRKQKTMLPTVSRRALPEGNRAGSTRLMARLVMIKVTLDMGSKMASAMVVKSDRELDVMAP